MAERHASFKQRVQWQAILLAGNVLGRQCYWQTSTGNLWVNTLVINGQYGDVHKKKGHVKKLAVIPYKQNAYNDS